MTYEEAITIANCWVRSRGAYTDRATWQTNNETAKLAIEALEKQIPKKLKYIPGAFYSCPTCGNGYGRKAEFVNHCFNCGQALLWEDTE